MLLGDFHTSFNDYHSPSLDSHDSMFFPTFHNSYKSLASLYKKHMSMFDALTKPNVEFKKTWEIMPWENAKTWKKTQTPLELAMNKSAKFIFGVKDNAASSDFFGAKPTGRQLLLSETAKGAITLDPMTGAKQSSNHAKFDNIYVFTNGKMSSLGSINPYLSDFETNSFSQSIKASVLQHQIETPKQKAWMSPYDFGAKPGKPPKTLSKQLNYAH